MLSLRRTDVPRHLGWTGGFVITSLTQGTSASHCRPALAVLCRHFGVPSSALRHLGTGLGARTLSRSKLGPRINTEHINQLSHFHAQRLSVLNFVWFDQALYFFGKKLYVKNFLVKTLFVTHKFKYPFTWGLPS